MKVKVGPGTNYQSLLALADHARSRFVADLPPGPLLFLIDDADRRGGGAAARPSRRGARGCGSTLMRSDEIG